MMDKLSIQSMVENLSPTQLEELVVDTVKLVFSLRQKKLDGYNLSAEEEILLESIGPQVDRRLLDFGEGWFREHGIVLPKPRVVDGVYIESTCPRCKVFGIYEVERGVDSIIECRSCHGKMRVRLGSK
ncbi:MAG: hypothetical protein WC477_06915 [Patescibacteria group bacterium]